MLLSSGIKETILNSLNKRRILRIRMDSLADEGISEDITIIVSKIFHPSEKKSLTLFSAANLIQSSIRKIIVIK